MAKLADWRGYAKNYQGIIVAWINQGEATSLQKVNSAGVCRAITTEWLSSYRGDAALQIRFVTRFRAFAENGDLRDAWVPEDYIEQQLEWARNYQLAISAIHAKEKDVLDKRKAWAAIQPDPGNAELLKKAGIEARAAAAELPELLSHLCGGRDCKGILTFNTFDQVRAALIQDTGAQFYTLSIRGPASTDYPKGFRHIVGFEFRPDRKPNVFEFLDANLGLLYFPTKTHMLDFVANDVWAKLYKPIQDKGGINVFGLFKFAVGKETMLTPEETLDLIVPNLKTWIDQT